MRPQLGYVAIHGRDPIGFYSSAEAGIQALEDRGIEPDYVEDYGDAPLQTNAGVPQGAKVALARLGLTQTFTRESVMSLSEREAFKMIEPILRLKHAKIPTVAAYTRGLLTQNAKTEKSPLFRGSARSRVVDGQIRGLNLLPHYSLISRSVYQPSEQTEADVIRVSDVLGKDADLVKLMDEFFRKVKKQTKLGFTTCASSNHLCRATCLAYSGQNTVQNQTRNYGSLEAKAANLLCLLFQPEAFLRLLHSNIKKFRDSNNKAGLQTFVRLNVLSDIPWEYLAPFLFEDFEDVQFYDYTKIPGRFDLPANYDLTFSYSGTNLALCKKEWERGRRIAITILAYRKEKAKEWRMMQSYPGRKGLPETKYFQYPEFFTGFADMGVNSIPPMYIVDGDRNDARPLDPPQSAVMLRWKVPRMPRTKTASLGIRSATEQIEASSFVVPAYLVEGADRRQEVISWLIAPNTPRMQGVEEATVLGD